MRLVESEEEKLRLLDGRLKQLDRQINTEQEQIAKHEQDNRLFYFGHPDKGYLGPHGKWDPNPLQRKLRSGWKNPTYTVFTFTGANRIGKTFMGLSMVLSAILGRLPDESPELGAYLHDMLGWKPPIKVRWVGPDWEKGIKGIIVPEIKKNWPKDIPVESKKNHIGVEAYWNDPNGQFSVEIMSNQSESDVFEGWSGHLIVWDEPPKRANRVAAARGLIDANGRELFCMTLLKEAWINKDVIKATLEDGTPDPSVFNVHGEIQDNVGYGLTQKGVDEFAKKLTDEEKDARLKGVPSYLTGLVLNIDREIHVKQRWKDGIPRHYMVNIAIDIHPSKPQHVLFQAIDPNNNKFLIFEIVGHGDGDWVGNEIIKKIDRYKLRVNRVIIDPLSKGDANNENSTYEKIDRILARNGLYLEVASKDKDDGILILREMLWTKNNIPSLFIFSDMVTTLRQVENWVYEEFDADKKNANKASKVDDDQCENLYRLALLDTEYVYPEDEDSQEDSKRAFTGNEITGY